MGTNTTSAIHRTTLLGGALLAVAGLIALLGSARVTLPDSAIPFGSIIPATIADIVLLAAFITLAVGVRGETGIVGTSTVGRVALILFGCGYLLFGLFSLLPLSPGSGAALAAGIVLQVLIVAAGLVAGVIALRAGVVNGAARWILLAVVVGNALWSIPAFIPDAALALSLAVWKAELVMPVGFVILGVSLAVHGRSAAIRHRLHAINENW
ncbi:hypothetical protein [Galbitalea soli]|uniref:Uncharacterized protein n=1 Tax=Galbitalea soli TaxID=1268042 RepID=A0A7C9TQS4_9MICO|nr:hypothetical protein [Galbitalea soli]NEM91656.1 hypothetical protein [Galbitalea soli]NYJ30352.1 hypothetical protein [Galbitalea soli]